MSQAIIRIIDGLVYWHIGLFASLGLDELNAPIINQSTTIEPHVVWESPSPPIEDPDCRDVIIEKPCIVGAQPTCNYTN